MNPSTIGTFLRRCEEYLTEVKHVKDALRDENPSPLLLVFPLLYRRYVADNPRLALDQRLLGFTSMYLSTIYPGLHQYFLSSDNRGQLELIKQQFTKILEDDL